MKMFINLDSYDNCIYVKFYVLSVLLTGYCSLTCMSKSLLVWHEAIKLRLPNIYLYIYIIRLLPEYNKQHLFIQMS